MSLKKKFLIAASLAALMPIASYADLTTINNTHEVSAVRVIATNVCSGDKGHFTEPGKSSTTSNLIVRALCLASQQCKAIMYTTKTCDAGTEIGNLELNSIAMTISSINVTNSMYSILGVGGSTVTINYR